MTPPHMTGRVRTGLAGVAAAAGLALVAGLGGCGLPSRTEPKYAGPAPSPAVAQGGVKSPPAPGDERSTKDLVTSFLGASVGANLGGTTDPDASKEALGWMKKFMTDATASTWRPKPGVTIVRDPLDIVPTGDNNGLETVQLQLHPIGVLNETGEVVVQPQSPDIPASFQTVYIAGRPRLTEVPDRLFISESGLKKWYQQRTIYFWEQGTDDPRLVPDLRYMPNTLSNPKQVNQIVEWLQKGPGALLQNIAKPTESYFKDSPVVGDTDVTVNLNSNATSLKPDKKDRLARQIRWSLPGHPTVHLMIENQPDSASSDDYEDDNVALEAFEATKVDRRYCVVNGSVRSDVIDISHPESPLFAPGGDNTNVVAGAINRQRDRAALVRTGANGHNDQRLLVSAPGPVSSPPKYLPTNVSAPRLSRPAWITYPVRRLLIADGDHLLISTDETAQTFEQVKGPTGFSTGPITAFSVSPEGRRVAYIANGALMVAPLQLDNGKLSFIGASVTVQTTLGNNQAVGWLGQTTLAVGGRPSPRSAHPPAPAYSLVSVTVDGAEEEVLPPQSRDESQLDVTQLVAQVSKPDDQLGNSVMFESNGVARRVYSTFSDPLQLQDLVPPSGNAPLRTPTAPFFAD
ncbi:LpqB family beta-propeller domain-containing protein [Dactylosporangium matsuzakiense]|uniref:Sporulation and spore germination protein n=1 Tax=Dactylosporangium matsuzakiense TaxID=53360 RepID=A0A9W6KU97_9ACTN|nr:LpqB family beta-propeller domain-containing protein [Dactylosporangium matsuzakiense]UWZ44108.1 hypothetical protein Dmats_43060 [Dactylosporangium matsuzakiense]GLL07398.1 hypothetical protein GCM10017581_091500 [Dactylosporangium matsuzakiense]